MSTLGPGGEFDLIRRFLAADAERRLPREVVVGPGDDAAVLSAHPLAISADLSIEGVHFRRDWLAPEEIGWRAAMAGLSDLAAMIARPVAVLLSVAVNDDDARDVAVRVVAGATDAARTLGARLVGGDVTRSPGPLVLDVIALGEVSHPLRRDGARAGDEVWVTGRLGAPAMAVRAWMGGARPSASARPSAAAACEPEPPGPSAAARERFARPRARTEEALWLRRRVDMTAGLDLSDGLAGDLPHIAAASGVSIIIDRAAVPVHPAAAERPELALTGGEEYELCLVSPAGAMQNVTAAFEAEFDVPLTRIGTVEPANGVQHANDAQHASAQHANGAATVLLRNEDGSIEPLPRPSYEHFGDRTG